MQTIYVRDERTDFADSCDACRDEAQRFVQVSGTLRRYVDIGFRSCPHGHRILVKRVRVMEAA